MLLHDILARNKNIVTLKAVKKKIVFYEFWQNLLKKIIRNLKILISNLNMLTMRKLSMKSDLKRSTCPVISVSTLSLSHWFCYQDGSPPLIKPPLLQWKSGLIRKVVSLERENVVVFYYCNASEIWPDDRDGFLWEWSYKGG
jgi:hypothetical protein